MTQTRSGRRSATHVAARRSRRCRATGAPRGGSRRDARCEARPAPRGARRSGPRARACGASRPRTSRRRRRRARRRERRPSSQHPGTLVTNGFRLQTKASVRSDISGCMGRDAHRMSHRMFRASLAAIVAARGSRPVAGSPGESCSAADRSARSSTSTSRMACPTWPLRPFSPLLRWERRWYSRARVRRRPASHRGSTPGRSSTSRARRPHTRQGRSLSDRGTSSSSGSSSRTSAPPVDPSLSKHSQVRIPRRLAIGRCLLRRVVSRERAQPGRPGVRPGAQRRRRRGPESSQKKGSNSPAGRSSHSRSGTRRSAAVPIGPGRHATHDETFSSQ